jgi:hypothetical protein
MWVAYFFFLSNLYPAVPSVQLGVLYASKKPRGRRTRKVPDGLKLSIRGTRTKALVYIRGVKSPNNKAPILIAQS